MINRTLATITALRFSSIERVALRSLREAYEAEQHIFTTQELARLRFLRWLVHSRSWNLAMDRPERIDEWHVVTEMRPVWTLGFTG
jgi:hypothetical protein